MPEIDFGKRRSSVCRRPWARLPEPRCTAGGKDAGRPQSEV